jgi:DNA-binding phage protein
LDVALAEGDPALVAAVLGDIARARGRTQRERNTPNPIPPLSPH